MNELWIAINFCLQKNKLIIMKEEKPNPNLISLNFSVTGKTTTIEKVNVNQPLQVSVQKALDETGSSRPIDEFEVLHKDKKLDITQKVESFNFPPEALLFVSLKTGVGGR